MYGFDEMYEMSKMRHQALLKEAEESRLAREARITKDNTQNTGTCRRSVFNLFRCRPLTALPFRVFNVELFK
jgi:hypothetical protein